ncbi:hypothetical protein [Bradyrhizobium sp. 604_D8_N2_3]|uniref:hypothetical protein n=1 Tax=Bradyrhizobium sp. 604_D8_N2_3 TaxID=3240370 RepID=UPI003F1F88A4
MIADAQASWNGDVVKGDPWNVLRDLLARYPQEHRPELPPFQGGAAGFFGYDMNRTLERLAAPAISGQRLPIRAEWVAAQIGAAPKPLVPRGAV